MTTRRVLLALLLLLFSAISGIAVAEYGYVVLWQLPFQNAGTVQLFSDLTVAMLLVTSWMVRDAKTSGVPLVPYLLLTVASGSFGPLLYLLHREWVLSRRRLGAERHRR